MHATIAVPDSAESGRSNFSSSYKIEYKSHIHYMICWNIEPFGQTAVIHSCLC